MSIETVITAIILVIVVIAILYIISIWIYKRAPANMGFVRTGFLGTKVCLGRGAIVLPVFHEVTWISLETIKLIVSRSRDQAILTADKIRIDVVAELYAHVGHTADDLLIAGRSLGEKTFDPDKVRNLLEAKIVSALRSYAATKTLNELHENRDSFAEEIKSNVVESFQANGLSLEEVTIVTLEQTDKEYFDSDNVFDAEGLKVITEVTSDARRRVHETEKRTTVSIRQKDLDTQLELLEIERQEAFARASQDKDVSNEQALQIGQKQIYVLDQRMAVEHKEIDNEKSLEHLRTERDLSAITEAERRETADIQKSLSVEQRRRDREIALIAKAREEEVAEIARTLEREQAEQDKQIALIAKQKDRQRADIDRETAITSHEEAAREERHQAAEKTTIAMRKRSLETQLGVLDLEKEEALATARQEQEVANEQAKTLSEKQRFILEQRWQVEREELSKALALEQAEIQKDVQVIDETKQREAAEIRRSLAREQEERDREIAMAAKLRELEQAQIQRLQTTTERERVEHESESVRLVEDAHRRKVIDSIHAQAQAEVREIEERNKPEVSSMHIASEAQARQLASEKEAAALLTRARADSESQQIAALGHERQAGATGRAEMEIETLRVRNTERMYEAEATGIQAKADALKNYNESATFLELAKMHIEAERDVHKDQAKAMGSALSGAQIRMYGGGDGTVDTIRQLFTSGFGLGEALEGVAQSLPEGVRERLSQDGIRGLFRKPVGSNDLKRNIDALGSLIEQHLGSRKAKQIPFGEAVAVLEAQADDAHANAISLLKNVNEQRVFDDVPFDKVWSLLQATAQSSGDGG